MLWAPENHLGSEGEPQFHMCDTGQDLVTKHSRAGMRNGLDSKRK